MLLRSTGTSATFTAVATGTNLSYQWQSGPAGAGCAGPWTDITGATSASYTVSGITVGMDNTGYHVVIFVVHVLPRLLQTVRYLQLVMPLAITDNQPTLPFVKAQSLYSHGNG